MAARENLNSQAAQAVSLKGALTSFTAYLDRLLGNRAKMWAKPPGFDLGMIANAYAGLRMHVPWHHKQEADVRTVMWCIQHIRPKYLRTPCMSALGLIKHNAMHDALVQAIAIQTAYAGLKLNVEDNPDEVPAP